MTLGNRVTVNAGLRFDHSRAISPDLAAGDMHGRGTTDVLKGSGLFTAWNVWSPRLDVTTKLASDGHTMLRASYGRSARAC